MKSDTYSVLQVFQDRRQYRVPFYQRAYTWQRDEQWEPLWDDIREKAETRIAGDIPAPHFLGAIVLEPQHRLGLRGVETYNIIDGQQRLATLQYFLAALMIVMRDAGEQPILSLVKGCIWNPNLDTMEDPEVECFKVWPTFTDREYYRAAMQAAGREELRQRFPMSFTQSGSLKKIGVDHPAALEAIWFFSDQIEEWCSSTSVGQGDHVGVLEKLAEAVLQDLKCVSISLEKDDDAQVIFETLNARGAALNATDLIRNFIFMRADREGSNSSNLYGTLWIPFEDLFWSEDQRRGRLRRPRREWFVQAALQAELTDSVEIGRLYSDYRRYVFGQQPPLTAENQLHMLTRHADNYRQLVAASGVAPIARFGRRIDVWDASSTHALALRIASIGVSHSAQTEIFDDIVSYVVRRAICGLTTKNYNNIFLQLLRRLPENFTPEGFRDSLAVLKGDTSRCPSDDEFKRSWLRDPIHQHLGDTARLRAVLSELENGLRSSRAEEAFTSGTVALDVDHILPVKWYTHWPLNGEMISEDTALRARLSSANAAQLSPELEAIVRREKLKATMGNLTLVHYGINRSLQNRPFSEKREALFAESNLHLNRMLMRLETWDEAAMENRGNELFEVARRIWPGPH